MQITCPSCSAEYEVPDNMLAGRAVQCVRCGTRWDPVPAVVEAAFEPASLPTAPLAPETLPHEAAAPEMLAPETLEQETRPAAPVATWGAPDVGAAPLHPPIVAAAIAAPPAARPKALLAAWIASIAVLVVIAGLAYVGRNGIMQAWPPSQRLYAAFGLR